MMDFAAGVAGRANDGFTQPSIMYHVLYRVWRNKMDWPRLLATDAANAPSRRELLAKALERLRIVFQLRIGAIIPLQDITDSIDDAIHFGIRETHVREYMTVWRARDPILHSALDARAPAYAHGPKAGSAAKLTVLCSDFGRRVGAGSYMVMPIYGSFG